MSIRDSHPCPLTRHMDWQVGLTHIEKTETPRATGRGSHHVAHQPLPHTSTQRRLLLPICSRSLPPQVLLDLVFAQRLAEAATPALGQLPFISHIASQSPRRHCPSATHWPPQPCFDGGIHHVAKWRCWCCSLRERSIWSSGRDCNFLESVRMPFLEVFMWYFLILFWLVKILVDFGFVLLSSLFFPLKRTVSFAVIVCFCISIVKACVFLLI